MSYPFYPPKPLSFSIKSYSGLEDNWGLQRKRDEINQETIASSNRALGMLHETEKLGVSIDEELDIQKEKLLSTEKSLDEVNSTLKTSERHLKGLNGFLGRMKNHFRSKRSSNFSSNQTSKEADFRKSQDHNVRSNTYTPDTNTTYQGNLAKGCGNIHKKGITRHQRLSDEQVDEMLNKNLDDMSKVLSVIKGQAISIGAEINKHNTIIDRIEDKAAAADLKIEEQNIGMGKILRKRIK